MTVFGTLARRRPAALGQDLSEEVRDQLPPHFEVVAEALVAGEPRHLVLDACAAAGRCVARDGAALGEALSGLRTTHDLVGAPPPAFDAGEALSVAWSETTLEYLHQLSCEDPLTGLASLAHIRSRLDEVYREAEVTRGSVQASHALVVLDLESPRRPREPEHAFARALRLVQLTETIRSVFSGGQTIARVGPDRVVTLVAREHGLGASVALLRDFLGDLELGEARIRMWIEGLPAGPDAAARLLDELAR